jgi:hypothetical protein
MIVARLRVSARLRHTVDQAADIPRRLVEQNFLF